MLAPNHLKHNIAILGPTGYTGLELIEIIARHPSMRVEYLGSARTPPPRIDAEFPRLAGRMGTNVNPQCEPIDHDAIAKRCKGGLAFLCLPHEAAMQHTPELLKRGLKVVDLSAAYPDVVPTLFKVWGRSGNEVYVVSQGGSALRFDGISWRQLQIVTNTEHPLFTVHGNDNVVVATGGFSDGVILELQGDTFVDQAMQDVEARTAHLRDGGLDQHVVAESCRLRELRAGIDHRITDHVVMLEEFIFGHSERAFELLVFER